MNGGNSCDMLSPILSFYPRFFVEVLTSGYAPHTNTHTYLHSLHNCMLFRNGLLLTQYHVHVLF